MASSPITETPQAVREALGPLRSDFSIALCSRRATRSPSAPSSGWRTASWRARSFWSARATGTPRRRWACTSTRASCACRTPTALRAATAGRPLWVVEKDYARRSVTSVRAVSARRGLPLRKRALRGPEGGRGVGRRGRGHPDLRGQPLAPGGRRGRHRDARVGAAAVRGRGRSLAACATSAAVRPRHRPQRTVRTGRHARAEGEFPDLSKLTIFGRPPGRRLSPAFLAGSPGVRLLSYMESNALERRVAPCAEFPNDNPDLHHGAIWGCAELGHEPACEHPRPRAPAPAPRHASGCLWPLSRRSRSGQERDRQRPA